jgi:hypothetical protein
MSRGKPLVVGPTAKLPSGKAWEELAGMTIPVKVGIFRDFRGFAVIAVCRGGDPGSGKPQE